METRRYHASTVTLYAELISMQKQIPFERIRPRSVLLDPEAGLRIKLLRAGAAWLIGWASVIVLLDRTVV